MSISAWDNPMGTDGFEFIEYAAPDPKAMGSLFERMGFRPIARHRHKNVVLYRQGAITAEQLEAATGKALIRSKPTAQASPGMLPLHYAPATPTTLVDDIRALPADADIAHTGLLCFRQKRTDFPAGHQAVLSAEGSLTEAAQNLYGCLHFLDDLKLHTLFVEKLPNIGLGISINDRLQKAAHS